MLNGSSFFQTVKKGTLQVFMASLYDVDKAIEEKDLKEQPWEEIIPEQYHEFLPLFSKFLAVWLPPHQPGIDHEVWLKEDETPTWGPLYSMWRAELVVFKEWLDGNMFKGLIWKSSAVFVGPGIFAKLLGGGLQFCIDYRDTKWKTVKNWYPLPLIQEMVNHSWPVWVYTELDVCRPYNLLQIKEGDQHKLAFWTRYGLFEPTVMQFGTTNAPADVQGYIKNIIWKALDDFVSAYFDDIFI